MQLTVRAGTRGRIVDIAIRDPEHPAELRSGLDADPGSELAFIRDDQGEAHRVQLTPGRPGVYSAASFAEVDGQRLPGIYRIGIPDEVLAEGATFALVLLRHPGGSADPIEINLVAYDPQDGVRLGMSALSPEARVAALHGAFPRLAAEEMRNRDALREPD